MHRGTYYTMNQVFAPLISVTKAPIAGCQGKYFNKFKQLQLKKFIYVINTDEIILL